MQLTGIHHLTAISADAPGNRAFYEGVLGMRLVKKTVNQDDVSAYHLFYADGLASPGTDITFFDWPVGARAARHAFDRAHGAARRRRRDARLVARPSRRPRRRSVGEIAERDGRLTLDFEDPGGPAPQPRRRRRRGRGASLGEEPGAGGAPDPRPRADHALRPGPRADRRGADRGHEHARRSRTYPHPRATARTPCMSTRWARAARRQSSTSPCSRTCRRRGRARAACITSPSARPTPNTMPGRSGSTHDAHSEQRQGRPLLFPQPLFPRAERHPVRDRHRRPRLRRRRAAGDARRAPGAAAVPRAAPRGDRSGAEAAYDQPARIALPRCGSASSSRAHPRSSIRSRSTSLLGSEATHAASHTITELDGYHDQVERGRRIRTFRRCARPATRIRLMTSGEPSPNATAGSSSDTQRLVVCVAIRASLACRVMRCERVPRCSIGRRLRSARAAASSRSAASARSVMRRFMAQARPPVRIAPSGSECVAVAPIAQHLSPRRSRPRSPCGPCRDRCARRPRRRAR